MLTEQLYASEKRQKNSVETVCLCFPQNTGSQETLPNADFFVDDLLTTSNCCTAKTVRTLLERVHKTNNKEGTCEGVVKSPVVS